MNVTLLNLLFTAQLAIDVNNPTDVKLTVLSVENEPATKADIAHVACTSSGLDGKLYYNYKMLKTESGENVKVDGEWRYEKTRPNGVQWTFVIEKDTYDSLRTQCMQDRNKYGKKLWKYVQPVKPGHENEQWFLFEMKHDVNSCGPGIVGTVPQLGYLEWFGWCGRSTDFLQSVKY